MSVYVTLYLCPYGGVLVTLMILCFTYMDKTQTVTEHCLRCDSPLYRSINLYALLIKECLIQSEFMLEAHL